MEHRRTKRPAPIRLAVLAALPLVFAGAMSACGRTGLGTAADPDGSLEVAYDAATDAIPDFDVDSFDLDAGDVAPDPEVVDDLPPPVCGDDLVTDGEECDDGALNSDTAPDACREDCRLPTCGDSVQDSGEECDDGDANDDSLPDACRTDCRQPRCGDGVVDSNEPCDDGNAVDDDLCDTGCRIPADVCAVCEVSDDCGRVVDRCLRLPDGLRCGIACGKDDDCPDDTVCTSARTAEGERVNQCTPESTVCVGCLDRDGDGYGLGVECLGGDCNDGDPSINPGAEEVCDDIDNDCDTLNDEGCPPDLIVDAEEVVLSGVFLFDRVEVLNGGILRVEPASTFVEECSPEGPGCLKIRARVVYVRARSTIDATGAGRCALGAGAEAGFGAPGLRNTGPGGGGYGGRGGAGPELSGGRPYGSDGDRTIEMGSAGGGFSIVAVGVGDVCDDLIGISTLGGAGGGCLQLAAPDIDVAGTIRSNGIPGESAVDGARVAPVDAGAGGSGGGIALLGDRVVLRRGAVVEAQGGGGGAGGTYAPRPDSPDGTCVGNGGGGGGGGRIKLFAGVSVTNEGATLRADAGPGGLGPQSDATSGTRGSIWIE